MRSALYDSANRAFTFQMEFTRLRCDCIQGRAGRCSEQMLMAGSPAPRCHTQTASQERPAPVHREAAWTAAGCGRKPTTQPSGKGSTLEAALPCVPPRGSLTQAGGRTPGGKDE